ncbi:unnamed protein product [Sympodiomycopsis kandeliae]
MASSTARGQPLNQARLKPLDNAEQGYALRQRLSHSLSHRPLLNLRRKLSALAASTSQPDPESSTTSSTASITLHGSSLLSELQSYLLSLTRTSISSEKTAVSQIEEYEKQYEEIRAEEEASAKRIVELKKQLEQVRTRRREKIEYGRVAESVERWFKTGNVEVNATNSGRSEIEESLSTLVSHLTSSFLYESTPSASSSSSSDDPLSTHSQTLTLLHSKLDEMLNLSRQVREIVGWKAGQSNAKHTRETTLEDGTAASNESTPQPPSHALNPSAKPFQPHSSSSKRSRGNNHQLEEGEEDGAAEDTDGIATPTSTTSSSKKRKLKAQQQATTSTAADDEEEEGSIPTANSTAPSNVISSSSRGRRGGPIRGGSSGPRGRPGRGRGRGVGGGGPIGWD